MCAQKQGPVQPHYKWICERNAVGVSLTHLEPTYPERQVNTMIVESLHKMMKIVYDITEIKGKKNTVYKGLKVYLIFTLIFRTLQTSK
jgi:hypothetical protein